MGKHAQSSAVQSSVQYGAEGSVLQNLPSRVHPAENLLKTAVWWIDAAHSTASGQSIRNLGWGGAVLDAQAGSTGSADSNDPKYLDWQGENYVYLPGVSGNYLSVPDEDALDITTAVDLRAKVSLDNWANGSYQYVLCKWDGGGGSFLMFVSPSGGVGFQLPSVANTSTATTGFAAGATKWIRATMTASTGASNFYTSDDGVTWTQLGTTVTAGAQTIPSTIAPITIGIASGIVNFSGKVYRAVIKNGIEGTTVLDVDCSQVTSGSATSFKANTGQTVTINRSTSGRKAVAVTQPVWLFGTDDYMTVPDNDLLDFGAVESFTVLMACRVHATPKSFGFYIGKWNPGYYMGNSSSTTNSFFVVNDGVDQADTNVAGLYAPYMLGSVTLIGGVLDRSSSTLRSTGSTGLVPAGRSTTAVDSLATTNALMVGSSNDFEFISAAIFRRALTASEIGLLSDYFQGRD